MPSDVGIQLVEVRGVVAPEDPDGLIVEPLHRILVSEHGDPARYLDPEAWQRLQVVEEAEEWD